MSVQKLALCLFVAFCGTAVAAPSANQQRSESVSLADKWTVTFHHTSCTTGAYEALSNAVGQVSDCSGVFAPSGGVSKFVTWANGGGTRVLSLYKNDACSGTGKALTSGTCTELGDYTYWKVA